MLASFFVGLASCKELCALVSSPDCSDRFHRSHIFPAWDLSPEDTFILSGYTCISIEGFLTSFLSAMPFTGKIVLKKPADWETWLSFVRIRAQINEIWDRINPELAVRPACLTKPANEPTFILPRDEIADFDLPAYRLFKASYRSYKHDLRKYEKQQQAFLDIINFVQETIAFRHAELLVGEESHPWNILRALKKRLAPSDDDVSFEVQAAYHRLCQGPGIDVELWVREWESTYLKAKRHGLAELTGTGPLMRFCSAIQSKEPIFAMAYEHKLDDGQTTDFLDLLEKFRKFIRRKAG